MQLNTIIVTLAALAPALCSAAVAQDNQKRTMIYGWCEPPTGRAPHGTCTGTTDSGGGAVKYCDPSNPCLTERDGHLHDCYIDPTDDFAWCF